jgi:hypothetical protein
MLSPFHSTNRDMGDAIPSPCLRRIQITWPSIKVATNGTANILDERKVVRNFNLHSKTKE